MPWEVIPQWWQGCIIIAKSTNVIEVLQSIMGDSTTCACYQELMGIPKLQGKVADFAYALSKWRLHCVWKAHCIPPCAEEWSANSEGLTWGLLCFLFYSTGQIRTDSTLCTDLGKQKKSCKVDLFLYLFFFSKRSCILKCVYLFLEALKLAFLINDNGAGKKFVFCSFPLGPQLN